MAVQLHTTNKRYLGLSTDVKPATAISAPVGSTFTETDTKDVYIVYTPGTWTKWKRNSHKNQNANVCRNTRHWIYSTHKGV